MPYDHFVEEGFKSYAVRMPKEKYARAIDSIVYSCVDVILINPKGEILLGRRTVYPCKDWWIIGGRMELGESFQETGVRKLKQEIGLGEIELSRFQFLGTYSLVWAKRAQVPQDHGSHATSVVLLLRISYEEAEQIMPNKEYEEMQWFRPGVILRERNKYQKALVKWVQDMEVITHQG